MSFDLRFFLLAFVFAGGCAKGCRDDAPRAKGTAPAATAKIVYRTPSSSATATAQMLARRLAALAPSFYRVTAADGAATIECDRDDEARIKADVASAPSVDVWAIDETTKFFAARAKDAPFPALVDGTSLTIPREHEEPLAKFVATFTAPDERRILLGARAGDDSFTRTFLVVAPAAIGGEHVVRVTAEDGGVAWRVAIALDDEGRAAIAKLSRQEAKKRIAIAIDGRVVAAPVVDAPLDGARVPVALAKDATREDAERLASRFANGARSIDLVASP